VRRPQVIDDEDHERVHERVAAIDVAKDSGMVCTRLPHPSRPGARRSTVWTVTARKERDPHAGPAAGPGRDRGGNAGKHLGLLADLEPARAAENGQTGRAVAGPADRVGHAAASFVPPKAIRDLHDLHPGPDPPGPGEDPLLPAAGKTAGRCPVEGVVRGLQADHLAGAGHDQGAGRRPARPEGAGRASRKTAPKRTAHACMELPRARRRSSPGLVTLLLTPPSSAVLCCAHLSQQPHSARRGPGGRSDRHRPDPGTGWLGHRRRVPTGCRGDQDAEELGLQHHPEHDGRRLERWDPLQGPPRTSPETG
jgi:hypothetical protein